MPRKNPNQVVIDPVAAAAQIGQPGMAADQGTVTALGMQVDVPPSRPCPLSHPNEETARFCAQCGLAMDGVAPQAVDLDAVRPVPAAQLTPEERAARDAQHADALRAAAAFDAQPEAWTPAEGEVVTIHFIADGLAAFGKVWVRGQEIAIGPSHPRWRQAVGWITLTRVQQIQRWGRQYFDTGPWPFGTTYLDGAGSFEKLATMDKKGTFSGPGEDALRQADEAERRRGRAVPALSR